MNSFLELVYIVQQLPLDLHYFFFFFKNGGTVIETILNNILKKPQSVNRALPKIKKKNTPKEMIHTVVYSVFKIVKTFFSQTKKKKPIILYPKKITVDLI